MVNIKHVLDNLTNGMDWGALSEADEKHLLTALGSAGIFRGWLKGILRNVTTEQVQALEWEMPCELYNLIKQLHEDMHRNYN